MTDPSPLVSALALILPPAYALWLGDAVTIASILSLLASAFSAAVKPPSAASPIWLREAYSVATWPALNLRWARNAVVPGMHAPVQQAALISAKLAAAAPELTTVAEEPAIKGAIAPATPTA